MRNQFNRQRHGSLYDRGGADSYYRRAADPHYFEGDTHASPKIIDLTDEETAEYMQGYFDNQANGFFKDYGRE